MGLVLELTTTSVLAQIPEQTVFAMYLKATCFEISESLFRWGLPSSAFVSITIFDFFHLAESKQVFSG